MPKNQPFSMLIKDVFDMSLKQAYLPNFHYFLARFTKIIKINTITNHFFLQ